MGRAHVLPTMDWWNGEQSAMQHKPLLQLVENSINKAPYFLLHLDMWVKCTSGCGELSGGADDNLTSK
jgi:hypothetical protein